MKGILKRLAHWLNRGRQFERRVVLLEGYLEDTLVPYIYDMADNLKKYVEDTESSIAKCSDKKLDILQEYVFNRQKDTTRQFFLLYRLIEITNSLPEGELLSLRREMEEKLNRDNELTTLKEMWSLPEAKGKNV